MEADIATDNRNIASGANKMRCISDYRPGDETDTRSPYFDDRFEIGKDLYQSQMLDDLKKIARDYSQNGYCKSEYNLDAWDILNALYESEYQPLIDRLINEAADKLAKWKVEEE